MHANDRRFYFGNSSISEGNDRLTPGGSFHFNCPVATGSHKEIAGTTVITPTAKIIAAKKGSMVRVTARWSAGRFYMR